MVELLIDLHTCRNCDSMSAMKVLCTANTLNRNLIVLNLNMDQLNALSTLFLGIFVFKKINSIYF